MVDQDVYKYVALGLLLCMGLFGGFFPLITGLQEGDSRWLSVSNCLAGGIFMGAGFLHMLPDAIEGFSKRGIDDESYPVPTLLCSLGFLLTFFLERVVLAEGHDALVYVLDKSREEHAYHDTYTPPQKGVEAGPPAAPPRPPMATTTDDSKLSRSLDDKTGGSGIVLDLDEHDHISSGWFGRIPEINIDSGRSIDTTTGLLPDEQLVRDRSSSMPHSWMVGAPSITINDKHFVFDPVKSREQSSIVFLHPTASDGILPYLLVLLLSVHSVITGVALGTSDDRSNWFLLLAIIAIHKFSAGFSLGVSFIKFKVPRSRYAKLIVFFSLMTPTGVGIGLMLQNVQDKSANDWVTAISMSISAGTFIYISLVDILLEEFSGHGGVSHGEAADSQKQALCDRKHLSDNGVGHGTVQYAGGLSASSLDVEPWSGDETDISTAAPISEHRFKFLQFLAFLAGYGCMAGIAVVD